MKPEMLVTEIDISFDSVVKVCLTNNQSPDLLSLKTPGHNSDHKTAFFSEVHYVRNFPSVLQDPLMRLLEMIHFN